MDKGGVCNSSNLTDFQTLDNYTVSLVRLERHEGHASPKQTYSSPILETFVVDAMVVSLLVS